MKKTIFLFLVGLTLTGTGCQPASTESLASPAPTTPTIQTPPERLDFSTLDNARGTFRFSATIPAGWKATYIPDIQAINLYDANADQTAKPLASSQIFIRTFTAKTFLTLPTVDILSRATSTLNGHATVRYEISKKSSVADFPNQPAWRNQKHTVVDVRFTKNNPSIFYVFARNPELPAEDFEKFLNSLAFHNDPASFSPPIDKAQERVTKKPFGLLINKTTSPVQPERFSGYHTGTDFEILDKPEFVTRVPVYAVCGGPLRKKDAVAGYGGVAIQDCLLRDQPITVLYGHLSYSNIKAKVGAYISPGQQIALLGNSPKETDSERKHLHLGFHKGSAMEIKGYVTNKSALNAWIDPCLYVCNRY